MSTRTPGSYYSSASGARACTETGCMRLHYARGWCKTHYARWTKHRAVEPVPIRAFRVPFWERVDVGRPGDCWEWRGYRPLDGYGRYQHKGRKQLAHRVSWELHHGAPAPDDLEVMHSCDNPPCVNPAHLSLGTHVDNMRDGASRGRVGWNFRKVKEGASGRR
jgi:hypothetical protein